MTPRQRLHRALGSETSTAHPALLPGSQADRDSLAHLYSCSLPLFPRSARSPGFFFVLQTTRTETHAKPALPWLCSGGPHLPSAQTQEFKSNHHFLLPLAFTAQPFCDLLGTPADVHQGHVLSSWNLMGASDGGWWSINMLTPSRVSKR